ncbi:hypothetical protein TrLO_g4211 [Triparma laevis f. longispina]|uniref:PARP-type domain-containing protein n=1 Tax=Triparma laevis f. longispina TaxID=1714387 RepID=A0A9W7KVX8_9STRA|nr:hypothetical protein TrLO_g4211 [Triparma laevis f. longispina]
MVSTRGSKVKAEPGTGTVKVKPEPKSRRSSGDGGVLGSPAPDKKKKAAPKKNSAEKKKSPAKKAKPKKGPGVDLRGAAAKSKSAAVLSALKANALGPDSMEGKRAEKMKAMGRAASDATVVTHIPNAPETVRYSIEVAKTGRSACKKSKLMIPKGALRWQCYTNGIGRGWIMLEHVTPVMLRNAIVAHGSLTAIHGFESMQANDAVRVCNLFKDILKNGGTKKGKKKATKKKGKKKSGGGAEQTLDENTAEVEDDDEILVAATESIDEVLARKLKEATMSGNLEVIDFSDDEEEAEVPGATQATEATASTSKMEKVFEKVVPMEIDEDDDEEYDDDEEEEEEEEDQKAPDLPDRPPVKGDLVFVKWDGDPKEYLCLIAESSEGGLEITSADQEFEDAVDLDPNLDVWRFSAGAQKSAPKKLKHGTCEER